MPWLLRGLREGVVTTEYPSRTDEYADHGVLSVVAPRARRADTDVSVELLCPTGAISAHPLLRVDQGLCIGCGACVRDRPDLFAWQLGSQVARTDRDLLVVPDLDGDEGELARLRARTRARTTLLRRSVHIRHVDAGSDGAVEWEIQALLNPVYDVHRLGIFFTASPRHADILLVTGSGAHGMTLPLTRTLEAIPRPVVVVAAGTDAISGGLIAPSYATTEGISRQISVDVWVPGAPPTPFALLHGLLLAMGRLTPEQEAGT